MKFEILLPQVIWEQGKQALQEDAVWPLPDKASIHDRLFVVADGLGNNGQGNAASKAVCSAVTEYLFSNTCPDEPLTNDLLRMALITGYERLGEACPDGVGTSLALLYMHRNGCTAVHIGDCRVYQVRPSSMALMYKSTDDFKAMMAQSKNPVSPEVKLLTNVRPGDYFLVCTKSLTAHLTDAQVVSIVCGERDDARKRQLLVNRSLQVEDNHSGVLVQVSGVMIETSDKFPGYEVVRNESQKGSIKPQQNDRPSKQQQSPAPRQDNALRQKTVSPVAQPLDEEPEGRKGGFPIVVVSAFAIVLLGCFLWWWMTRETASSAYQEPTETPVEKVDSAPQKDTMKIVDTKSEVKKDTTRIRNAASNYKQKADSLLNTISASEGAATSEPTTQPESTEPAVRPAESNNGNEAPAVQNHEPAPVQPAPQQPANPNGGVTPRPVIPEE